MTRLPHPTPDPVGPGQESVWAYPRPPRLEPAIASIRVQLGGVVVAASDGRVQYLNQSALRIWEGERIGAESVPRWGRRRCRALPDP